MLDGGNGSQTRAAPLVVSHAGTHNTAITRQPKQCIDWSQIVKKSRPRSQGRPGHNRLCQKSGEGICISAGPQPITIHRPSPLTHTTAPFGKSAIKMHLLRMHTLASHPSQAPRMRPTNKPSEPRVLLSPSQFNVLRMLKLLVDALAKAWVTAFFEIQITSALRAEACPCTESWQEGK